MNQGSRVSRLLALTVLTVLTAACAFEPGGWFATIDPSLAASYETLPEREAGAGWQKLSNDYEVKVTRARLALSPIVLLGSAGAGANGAARFDPAKPPEGYTLCHNGHCHSTDGRLVPYAEIEASLAGSTGGGGLTPRLTLAATGPLDLLMPGAVEPACDRGCGLDRTRILRVRAPLARLELEGLVRDSRSPGRLTGELPFTLDLRAEADGGAPAIAPTLEAEVDLPADRAHAPAVTLGLHARLTPALFDGVDFAAGAAAAGGKAIELGAAPSRAALERLLANLREGAFLTTSISR